MTAVPLVEWGSTVKITEITKSPVTQTLDLPIIPSVRSSYTSAGNRIIQNKISISYGLIEDDFVCERRAQLPLVFLCGKACISSQLALYLQYQGWNKPSQKSDLSPYQGRVFIDPRSTGDSVNCPSVYVLYRGHRERRGWSLYYKHLRLLILQRLTTGAT